MLSFSSFLKVVSRLLRWITNQLWLSVALIGLLAFGASALVGLIQGIPAPVEHDEFSYLLAADTFAHGRLTNPTHPMWIHFESFHILQHPTYQSKYPPAQGLILAAGQIFSGLPIVGVWITFALMCAAICWMLHAWVPPRWALMGGILAVIHPQLGFAGYWAQSYWGGAVAALGGTLVLGSVRRLMRRPQVITSLVMAVGFGILANSRPFEGLLLSLPTGALLTVWIFGKNGPSLSVTIKRIFLPAFVLLTLTATCIAYYNFRITRHPLRLPYQVYEATYAVAPLFVWQKLRPEPTYHHQVIRDYQKTELVATYELQHSIRGLSLKMLFFIWSLVTEFFNVYAIPLIAVVTVLARHLWRYRWTRFGIITCVILFCGVLSGTYLSAHYFSPIAGINYFFVVTAIRLWRRHEKKGGKFMSWFIPILALFMIGKSLYESLSKDTSSALGFHRPKLLRQLDRQDGKHLIIVGYGPTHSAHYEWVYNEADIDNAKVVWARKMERKQDCIVAEYFSDRRIWSLEIGSDQSTPNLAPYQTELCQR